MARIYISGPMTGLPDLNFPAFHEAAAKLRALGHDVVNPAELDAADAVPMAWADYMRRDIVHLMACDGVALLPGYTGSKGARLELHIAEALGLDVWWIEFWIQAGAVA